MPAGMKRKFAIRLVLVVALGLLSALAVGTWLSPDTAAHTNDTTWGMGANL
jgi:hypothetical protein